MAGTLTRRGQERGRQRRAATAALALATFGINLGADAADKASDGPDLRTFGARVAPFLRANCVGCHGPRRQRGDLRLDTIDGNLVRGRDAATWKEVYDRLNRGEMPPKAEPRPPTVDVDGVTAWIVGETRKADRLAHGTGGRVLMRRLNRAEYANTLRDLLHVRFPFGDGPLDLLPADGTAQGFDKVGSALTLDPSLLGQYLAVARHVADTAIVDTDGPPPVASRRRRFEFEDTATSVAIGYQCHEPSVSCRSSDLVLMDGAARTWDALRLDPAVEPSIPVNGEYTLRVRMSAELGTRGEPLKVQLVWPSDTVLATWTLGQEWTSQASPRVFEVTLPIGTVGKTREGPFLRLVNGTRFYDFNQTFAALHHEADQATAAGDLEKAARLLAFAKAEGAASSQKLNPAVADRARLPRVMLDWIELKGPIVHEWPPASHRALFFEGAAANKDLAYARRIFERLLPRAYRRPVTAADVEPVVAHVQRERAAGETFEEAIRVGLQDVLCSPKFLFLVEPERGPARPLGDDELAARLSYFLWSSLPDDELVRLTAAKRLRAPGVLETQVARMLGDDKARAFVDGFGAAWLQAPKFVSVPPNRRLYKDWDDELEAAVKREPLAFFGEVMRADLSVLNFLDSDFAMLNARLARHYGIPGVTGDAFRRVALPSGSHRGGLVTQAAVLTLGADGTRTLPVRRASWILQTLFNAPPPPPPANVREVEPNINGQRLTVRERLVAHQTIPACASCHAKIDPYGFALESYDAVGAWRTRQTGEDFGAAGGPAIDASGTLPDGRAFHSTPQFLALLRADEAAFSRALCEKMLTYALGRTLASADDDAVAALVTALRAGDHRMSALITAIAKSPTFQTR